MTYVTVTMGGDTPRSHATAPATTGTNSGAGSYRDWYVRPVNDDELQAHHALWRDAEERVRSARDHDNRNECELATIALHKIVEAAPPVGPSACSRHEAALVNLPPLAYVREWGRQQRALRPAGTRAAPKRAVCPTCKRALP